MATQRVYILLIIKNTIVKTKIYVPGWNAVMKGFILFLPPSQPFSLPLFPFPLISFFW